MNTVLSATDLGRDYSVKNGLFAPPSTLRAVDGVSLRLTRGETLAVVGESGCGKSTLARMIAMIEPPSRGTLDIAGHAVVGADAATLRALRPRVQIVFQNPYGSLNPRQKIGHALEEPLRVNTSLPAAARKDAAHAMLASVGLRPEHFDRYPHMFSGGQRQRIAIARALMLDPEVLVLDEPVSALDISIQAQVLNLLADMQTRHQLAYVFISHDLSVVRHIADAVMVMYLGRIVEQGPRDAIFTAPRHPYTRALLSATPRPEPRPEPHSDPQHHRARVILSGELPSPLNPPTGCTFHPRCPLASDLCKSTAPALRSYNGAEVACHHVDGV